MNTLEFETRLSSLDIGLFSKIKSQTSVADKKSLLDIQNSVRHFLKTYVYLEIGSHLGGSIQPHLIDDRCRKIFSIDKRPFVQPDERYTAGAIYPDNSTLRMLANLKTVSPNIMKVQCFDADSQDVDVNEIVPKPDICFIDGEHTNQKAFSDFMFCMHVLNQGGVIVFHDSNIIAKGIDRAIKHLKIRKMKFRLCYLPSTILVLDFTVNGAVLRRLQAVNFNFYLLSNFWVTLKRKVPKPVRDAIKFW